jgi:hypothetical protein
MNIRVAFAVALALLLSCATASAAADPAYTALRAARPSGPGVSVQNFTLVRDVMRFRFEKGVFQFAQPVEGRVTGAVFVGEGSWELNPANDGERRALAVHTGEKGFEILTDRFDEVVLLFTDGTEAEIRGAGTEGAASPSRAAGAWDGFRSRQRKDLKVNLQIRLLADVLAKNDPASGVFLAGLPGKKLPAAVVVVDPAGLGWFAPDDMPGAENSALYVTAELDRGFWYLARRKAEGVAAPRPAAADAERYTIDSKITENTRLDGTTTIRFKVQVPGLRVLPLLLFDKLRIQEAAYAEGAGESEAWTPAAFVQEKEDEDSNPAVVLPSPPPPGTAVRLRLHYEGKDVLYDTGDGSFAVRARQSWYPNLGTFRDLAAFDLTYRTPKGKQVVSVGERASEKYEGNDLVSVWKAEQPIRVAGFNYGEFVKRDTDDKDSGMKVAVFTNPGTPDIIKEIDLALRGRRASPSSSGDFRAPGAENYWGEQAGLHGLRVDTEAFAQGAMADGLNSVRLYTAYFGPLVEKHVAITQQSQWFFGQSWPSLIFLPYLAVLDGTQRHELGLGGAGTNDFIQLVGPHEVAHQWWGHAVGWDSYRDLWLSEGFAEFSAALLMQRTLGARRTADYWERTRKRILDKPPGSAVSNDQAGPITLGSRLHTRETPWAYFALVYLKGAYVLQMLRALMWDSKARPPDAAFIEMMRDYVTAYSDRNASTRDFQNVVERHMTPAMDLTHDGRMDWFFKQWVHGTAIPRYAAKVDVEDAGGDQYHFKGTVSQEGVPPDFRGFLPLYIEFDKGEVTRFALVTFQGNQTNTVDATFKLPRKPRRVVANALHDVLTRD